MAERKTIIWMPDNSEAESAIPAGILQDVLVGSADWDATENKGPGAESTLGPMTLWPPGTRYGIKLLDFAFCDSELG